MSIDYVKSLLAILLSAVIAYACYSINDYERVQILLASVSFVEFALFSVLTFGVKQKEPANSFVLTALSITIMLVGIGMNLIFSFFDFNIPTYIVLNGLLVILYLLIYVSIHKTHQ